MDQPKGWSTSLFASSIGRARFNWYQGAGHNAGLMPRLSAAMPWCCIIGPRWFVLTVSPQLMVTEEVEATSIGDTIS